MEDATVSSDPDVTEVREILLAMQKHLECPICLEVMKVPVSSSCAHVFCRFCISKLLSQKNGKVKCPLCNAIITKRSLWEEVQCEQVIKAVLEAIGALEYDTGFNFLGGQCLHKKALETGSAAVLQEKQTIVESKGYRDRLNGTKKGDKRKRTLQNKSSHSSVRSRTVTRSSLRKKANSGKTVCFEIGSDSSDDVFQEADTVKRLGLRSSSWSREGERHAKKQRQSPCYVELQKPSAEDVVLGTPGECSLSEAGPSHAEGTQANTGNMDAVEENVAAKKRRDASFPVFCVARHSRQPVSSSTQDSGSCSLLGMERPQLVSEATDPAPKKQAGNKAEPDNAGQTAGSVHTCDLMHEDQPELQQGSPNSPLSDVPGKKLKQSIQKVSEWLSKSMVLSPSPLQDVCAQEVDPGLRPHLLDVDSQKSKPTEDQWEVAAGSEVGRPLSKPVASKMVDKIFGRIYKRACKSNPVGNVRETIHISAKESCAAVNRKTWDTPIRKISGQKKTTLEPTSEDAMKNQTVVEVIGGPACKAKAVLEEDGHGLAVLDETLGAEQRPAELTVKEGASSFESDASSVCCHSCNLYNQKEARNSLRKRNWRPIRPVCALHLTMPESSWSPEKTQAHVDDDSPSHEGSREASADQMHIRRSKRLLLWAEGQQRGSEPARKQRKQTDRRAKKKTESQAGKVSISETEGGSGMLHSSQRGMVGDASKVRAFLDGKGPLSAEHPTESYSPCCVVPDTHSQGSCLPLPCHRAGGDQTDLKGKEFTAPQAEQSGLCTQAPEGNGFCSGDIKESSKTPQADDKAKGNLGLNPETDDSELDIDFTSMIFHHCKRRSFLLHQSPLKNSPTVNPMELSVDRAEGSEAVCVEKSIPGIAGVIEERREAVTNRVANSISGLSPPSHPSHSSGHGNQWEHLQVTSQTLFPDSSCTPVASKENKSANLPWNQKPGTEKRESSEMETIADADSCSCGSSGRWRSGSSRGTSLHPADGKTCNSACFLGTRPESTENEALACSSHPEQMQLLPVACQPPPSECCSGSVEKKSGFGGQKPLKGIGEQPDQMSSTGLLEGHLEQFSEDKTPDFQVLSDTPDDLLGPATESKECLLNPCAMDQQDTLAMFAETDQGMPLENSLECSSSSRSGPEGMAQARRRRVQKLSSSEEDKSSEDEELPCFQMLLFGRAASPLSQPMKEEEVASADILPWKSSDSSCLKSQGEGGSPSQESEGSVNLFSSQSQASENSTSKPCYTRPVSTSTGKVMTPRTVTESPSKLSTDAGQPQDGHQGSVNADPNLGEALGYDSEVSHLGDSLGLSSQSEILTTQQKETMQNNLKKLQQEMAILEAALKEGDQWAATEVVPLPNGESVFPGGQACSARGSAAKLKRGRKQSLLITSPPAGTTHGTVDDHSTSSATAQEHVSCCLAAEPGKGSPIAIQEGSSTPELMPEGKPISSFATSVCSGRKWNCKSLLSTSKRSMSLVASGLFPDELLLVQKFARKTKSAWSNTFSNETTHVVMKTDEDLVCERTLKYFLGIAAQKWVVSHQWVLLSLKEGRVLNEGDFEVRGDTVNGRNHQGPKRARESSTGKLFQGLEICCYGPFTDMHREQLEWMVELCGASLVKQPHLFSCSANSTDAVVVIQPEAWTEDTDCQGIPPPRNVTIVAREWVLDSIACYQRMEFDGYVGEQA